MREGFSLSIEHHRDASVVRCAGDLDMVPAERLREAVDTTFERDIDRLTLDCRRVSLLNSAGITALVDIAIGCRSREITLDLALSPEVRRVLDVVGLWWLGVVDDGIAVEESLQRALRVYADQDFAGTAREQITSQERGEDPRPPGGGNPSMEGGR